MLTAIIDPATLFFVFGIAAGLLKSNLEIPLPVAKFLSLYLLMALGLKGGFSLSAAGYSLALVTTVSIGLFMAVLVPCVGYLILRRIAEPFDAVSLAATYGSVSAVTFVTATQFLSNLGVAYDSYMAAVMALMETPAILLAVFMANRLRTSGSPSWKKILHESFTDGTHLLLVGALLIGLVTGAAGFEVMKPFTADLFKGLLAFFLLDMGIQVAKRLPEVLRSNAWLIVYALVAPILHAICAMVLGLFFGLATGNVLLLMVLSASASYIAVPAVAKTAIPEANPGVYVGLSMGLTFPFNVIVGIPLYHSILSLWT